MCTTDLYRYASYAFRYLGSSVSSAGLFVGVITVVAGVGGSVLGATAASRAEASLGPAVGSRALFAVPALFTFPGTVLLVWSLLLNDQVRVRDA